MDLSQPIKNSDTFDMERLRAQSERLASLIPLEDAALAYQDALARQERARRLASLAQEKADKFIAEAEIASAHAKDTLARLQHAAEYHNRDFIKQNGNPHDETFQHTAGR
jgi:hypothetical protein